MEKDNFLKLLAEIVQKLESNNIKYEIPYCYKNKKEYTNIVILISNQYYTYDLTKFLNNVEYINEKDDKITIRLKGVDFIFIRVPEDLMLKYLIYYNYEITHVFIKCMAEMFDLTYNECMLQYKDENTPNIYLTNRQESIFEFFNLDFKIFCHSVFYDLGQFFSWFASSSYYNPKYYTMEKFKKYDKMFEYHKEYYEEYFTFVELWKRLYMALAFDSETINKNFQIQIIDKFFPRAGFLKKYMAILAKKGLNPDIDIDLTFTEDDIVVNRDLPNPDNKNAVAKLKENLAAQMKKKLDKRNKLYTFVEESIKKSNENPKKDGKTYEFDID